MEEQQVNNEIPQNYADDDADLDENPDLVWLAILEWNYAFFYASEVITKKCSLELLQNCREHQAVSLVEDVRIIFRFFND